MGNLPEKSFFDLDLKKFFEGHGYKIKAATVASDSNKTKTLGYGYVTFYDEEELERCLSQLNNVVIQDKQVILNRQGDFTKDPLANIIIRNLSKNTTQQDIYSKFA